MSARAQVTSFQFARNVASPVCARGLHVASPWRVLGDRTLSVMAGLPLPSTGRVRGHCDLLTSKPEFLGVITPPIASEFSGSSSLFNGVLKNSVNGIAQRNHGASL